MKQYIDSSGPGLIVGFDNRAFVVVSKPPSSTLSSTEPPISYELLAPPSSSSSDGKNNKHNQGNNGINSKKTKLTEEEEHDRKGGGEEGEEEETVDKTKEDVTNGIEKFSLRYQQDANSIQVVTCQWVPESSILHCAVSRYDKTVSIYSISPSSTTTNQVGTPKSDEDSDEKETQMVPGVVPTKPILVHKLPKRSCTLAFATVPSRSQTMVSSSSSMMVIIAGDLAGDAFAFPVQPSKPSNNTINNAMDDHQPTTDDKQVPKSNKVRRLLLGHTASMLTSIHIVPQLEHDHATSTITAAGGGSGGSKILTADRDEKVRISSFPNTFQVEGYLLGHTAYITTMDLVQEGEGGGGPNPKEKDSKKIIRCCVTGSGDGTVRLWDISNCIELCRVDYLKATTTTTTTSESNGDPISKECNTTTTPMDVEQNCDGNEEKSKAEQNLSSPTKKGLDESNDISIDTMNGNGEGKLNNPNERKSTKDDNEENSNAVLDTTTADAADIDHAPVRVSVNQNGTLLAVMRDGIKDIDLFSVHIENNDDNDNNLTGALSKIHSIECPFIPLGMKFTSDGYLTILTKEPTFIVRWKSISDDGVSIDTKGGNDQVTTNAVVSTCNISQTLRNIAQKLKLTLPHTLLETNESTGKVKLRKNIQEEKEGFVKYEPWLSVERVEKAKQRDIRHKKRKREKTKLLGS